MAQTPTVGAKSTLAITLFARQDDSRILTASLELPVSIRAAKEKTNTRMAASNCERRHLQPKGRPNLPELLASPWEQKDEPLHRTLLMSFSCRQTRRQCVGGANWRPRRPRSSVCLAWRDSSHWRSGRPQHFGANLGQVYSWPPSQPDRQAGR